MVIRVIVNLDVRDGADVHDVVNECDYYFDHPDIISTEIVDMEAPE